MILGQEAGVGQWACPRCGNVYNVFSARWPETQRPSLNCDCGELIVWGRGTTDYSKVWIGKADPVGASRNPTFDEPPPTQPLS